MPISQFRKSLFRCSLLAIALGCFTLGVVAQTNQVLSLNGTSSYVSIPSSSSLQPSSAITLEAWVFPIVNGLHNPIFIAKSDGGDNSSQRSYELAWPGSDNNPGGIGGGIQFNLFLNTSTWAAVGAPVTSNQWTHIAVTYASNTGLLQMYTNGVLAASSTNDASGTIPLIGQTVRQTSQLLYFGVINPVGQNGPGGTWAAGYMDEIRIWSTNRSAAEIFSSRFCRLTGTESNLMAYYTFDQGTVADLTSNGNNGSLLDGAAIIPIPGQDVVHAGPCGEEPQTAAATAIVTNGFVIGASITSNGFGYTNVPAVRIIGGGGTGAQAEAVVSNGVVVNIIVLNAGSGYSSSPLLVIDPPFIANPQLSITPMSFLSFSNLTVGGAYQLQRTLSWYWTNLPVNFTAISSGFTQLVSGVTSSQNYRLALSPVPAQAFATATTDYGFVVNATVTSGGSGYVTPPAVSITGGGGTNATAVCSISNGVVTGITITSAGFGYTNLPTIQIAPPPVAAVFPEVSPVMRLDASALAPYDNYQVQFKPSIASVWQNWSGGLFSPTNPNSSQFIFITNGTGFFRLEYVP